MKKIVLSLLLVVLPALALAEEGKVGPYPTITVGTVSACYQGTQVEVPISINNRDSNPDCTFAVSFDKTKLKYIDKIAGNMSATVLTATIEDINAAGKVQPIVNFSGGLPLSGTICKFKFQLLTVLPEGSHLDLPISEIVPDYIYGMDGGVYCSLCPTWFDLMEVYRAYIECH